LAQRYVPPRNVDGATLFVGRTGTDLREFIYTDAEQAYQAYDLALLARHLFHDPIDQAPATVTRDVTVRGFGWHRDLTKSLWRIAQDDPLAFTLLMVVTEIQG
jgi:hypothetical protein